MQASGNQAIKLLRYSRNLLRRNQLDLQPSCLLSSLQKDSFAQSRSIGKVKNEKTKDPNVLPSDNYNTTSSRKSGRETIIQTIGNKNEYDAVKQLRLVELPDELNPYPNLVASMHVKRNIIFGTRIHDRVYLRMKGDKEIEVESCGGDNEVDGADDNYNNFGFVKVCRPLLKASLDFAGKEGDQPQGLASLGGLCARVRYLINNPSESIVMEKLTKDTCEQNISIDEDSIILNNDEKKIMYEAITSVATQIPRHGHNTVGLGTYLDARRGWTALAKEYALSRRGTMIKQGESQLFQSHGAVLVAIEYIGEENPAYWIDSGGAMARFYFV